MLKEHQAEIARFKRLKDEKDAAIAAQNQRTLKQLQLPAAIVRYERHSLAVAMIPFGAGQFQNGQRRKGWWFFGAETALAAVSLGAFVTNFALYGFSSERGCNDPNNPDGILCPSGDIDHSQEETSQLLTRIQVGSGAAFFAVAIWGVIDAVRNFKQEVPLNGNGNGTAARQPPPRSTTFRLTLSPSGLGAAWTF